MEEMIKLIVNYGVSIIIIGLFLWDWLTNKKKANETLEEVKLANLNIAKSLELLQKTMDNQNEFLKVHDKRCEATAKSIAEVRQEIIKLQK